jgi:hypothetical protein
MKTNFILSKMKCNSVVMNHNLNMSARLMVKLWVATFANLIIAKNVSARKVAEIKTLQFLARRTRACRDQFTCDVKHFDFTACRFDFPEFV